jgi:hypothetical protein
VLGELGISPLLGVGVKGFEADVHRRVLKGEGFRLRRIRPRCYRREITVNLWVRDVDTGRIERSPAATPVRVRRPSPLTGERETVAVDEVASVPMAWHYLPSVEVLKLVGFVRRDGMAGLTGCERRWAVSGVK